jgi:predicted NBD/HSP70 family sugar kinase
VAFGPNLRWRDVPLQERLAARWSVPVAVDNDTSAAALAEKLFGAAREARDFVVIAGHSGIGGALYLGGRLQRGCGGFAGEVGHMKVVQGGRPCGCGDRGCLEAYLSEHAVEAQLRERGRDLQGFDRIAAAALAGDATVLTLLDELGTLLGRVVADLIDVLDPALVILAGSLSHVAPYLLPAVERVRRRGPRRTGALPGGDLGVRARGGHHGRRRAGDGGRALFAVVADRRGRHACVARAGLGRSRATRLRPAAYQAARRLPGVEAPTRRPGAYLAAGVLPAIAAAYQA